MVDLISTMAEELNYIRSRVQSGGAVNTIPVNAVAMQQMPLFNSQPVKSQDLINVSDDESDDDSESDEESDEESGDDNDEEDDESDDSDSSDSEEEEDEPENVRVINISDSLLHSIEESGEVEEIPSEENDDINDSSEDEDNLVDEDDKSSVSSEEESKVDVVKLDEIMEEPQEVEPVLDIDSTLLKSIHMTFPTSENIDYKKLSLNKLRQIVSEKNLSSDSSKLKKPELLKLLGVE
jgi:hypothetical protein